MPRKLFLEVLELCTYNYFMLREQDLITEIILISNSLCYSQHAFTKKRIHNQLQPHFVSEAIGYFFLILCYYARHLQQIH